MKYNQGAANIQERAFIDKIYNYLRVKSIMIFILTACAIGTIAISVAYINTYNKKGIKNQVPAATGKGFAVVELFTSEGCSSCPPADELAEKIQRDSANRDIYILAFHVDYWDHQGWKDSFSDHEYSIRQRQYAAWLHLEGVYTPQVVVNGATEYVGSDREPILKAISAGLARPSSETLKLYYAKGTVGIEYKGAGNRQNSEVVLALVQKSAQSNVRAGENSGKVLSHVQIVRNLYRLPVGRNNIHLDFPPNFNEKGWELVAFVQHKSDGHITAADRFDFETKL